MKNGTRLLISVGLLILMFFCTTLAGSAASDFEIDSKGVLVKYNGYDSDVVIPDGVTAIGDGAFYRDDYYTWYELTSVKIPEGVKSIGKNAFSQCNRLKSVTIPSSVTSIGGGAFSDCSSLTSITIPSGVKTIENDTFSGCSSLTSITIPSGVTSIGEWAFSYCSSLTSITIPSGVKTIENDTFYGCSSLTSITIPSGVTSIGDGAFSYCSSLTSITIPSGVTSIERLAFRGCDYLMNITLPASVEYIRPWAFPDSTYDPDHKPGWYSKRDKTWISGGSAFTSRTGIADTYYAYDPSNTQKTTSVSIKDPKGTVVTGKSISLYQSEYQLSAAAAPKNTLQRFLWKSSNLAIATVDKTGKVNFAKEGTVKITVTTIDGSKKSASVSLTLHPKAESITIQDASGKDITGQNISTSQKTYQLKVKIIPVNAVQKVSWFRDSTIATVSEDGLVTFSKYGTIELTAKAEDESGISASVKLTWGTKAKNLRIYDAYGSDITDKTITISSATYRLRGVATPSDASQQFNWISSDNYTATVDSDGYVTFRRDGTVAITVETTDGSGLSAAVWLRYSIPTPGLPNIAVNNIRGFTNGITVKFMRPSNTDGYYANIYDYETGNRLNDSVKITQEKSGSYDVMRFYGTALKNGHPYRMVIYPYNKVGNITKYGSGRVVYGAPNPRIAAITAVPGDKSVTVRIARHQTADGYHLNIYQVNPKKMVSRNDITSAARIYNKVSGLQNGKLYYAEAIPYTKINGTKCFGASVYLVHFVPLSKPAGARVSFTNSSTARVSMSSDSAATGIKVMYRVPNGAMINGCEASGTSCTVSGLNRNSAYEFYVMKYKIANGKKHYGPGVTLTYKTTASGLPAPSNILISKEGNKLLQFGIAQDDFKGKGISVLYREGEGSFQKACEQNGRLCRKDGFDWSKDYTFYIMQYRVVNGKKVYSPGVTVTNWLTPKTVGGEDGLLIESSYPESSAPDEIYEVLEDYMTEDDLARNEVTALLGQEELTDTGSEDLVDEEFINFDEELYTEEELSAAEAQMEEVPEWDVSGAEVLMVDEPVEDAGPVMPETEMTGDAVTSEAPNQLNFYRIEDDAGGRNSYVPSFPKR